MRHKLTEQIDIFHTMGRNEIAKELKGISDVLDANPEVLDPVYKDLTIASRSDTGRTGMTAEQVLRSAILKQYRNLTYEELAFHLEDSKSFRSFARLDMGQYPVSSVLQDNIKCITEGTWEAINRILVRSADKDKTEKGRKVRIDATAVETNIHTPSDSTLLCDGVRIITRWLEDGQKLNPRPMYEYSDHNRVMKKRFKKILNSKKEETRKAAYKDLIHYAGLVCEYAEDSIVSLSLLKGNTDTDTLHAVALRNRIEKALVLLKRVIDQTERRVFKGEKVPANEKVVSFFETHTDIIEKGNRDTEFGHKVFFTTGSSNLVLDCVIEKGNPADSTKYIDMVNRQKEIFGQVPLKTVADGAFASKENLLNGKEAGVRDVAFSKKRGLKVLEMVKSTWVYRQLHNFRAGIEANISHLKRSFGLRRCNWTGWEGFKQYVWSSVVSYNLLALARLNLKTA